MRGLLLTTLTLAMLVAGCAENGGTPGVDAPLDVPSNADAAALFSTAAGNVPDTFGLVMTMTKGGTELMSAEAVFDQPAEVGYFRIEMDESVTQAASGGMDPSMMFGEAGTMAIYSSPQGSAFIVEDKVILMPPDDENPMMEGASSGEGFDTLADPEEFLAELESENVTVTSVTATTLRGKPALKLEANVTDEEGTQPLTVYLFQEPTRVARIEATMPAEEDEEDSPFVGATMTMDFLYDEEITVEIPEDVARVMGLRYQSDRDPFSGFGDGSGDADTETWSFQVDSAIALGEVEAQVREGMGDEADDAPPAWTMKLSESPKTVDTMTLTYADADGDGKVSVGDTLTITRGEGTEHLGVSLKDLVSGLRVTPGAGTLLALLGLAAALALGRRS